MLTAIDELFRRSLVLTVTLCLIAGMAVVLGLILIIRALARGYRWYAGDCVVTCPDTEEYAAVKLNVARACITSLFGKADVRVKTCSNWPKREGCAQDCTWQLDLSPVGCRVRELLEAWYQDKGCAFCGQTNRRFRHPALLSPRGTLIESENIRPEAIPLALQTHKPVCENCKFEWFNSRAAG